MDDKKKRGRILRFAVSGALLVGASGVAACGDDDATINEPYEEHTINEPPEEPTPNSPPMPPPEERIPGEMSSNEPAPEPEESAEEQAEAETE
jgi:hypothetical protein